jgi:hypothetical protein
MPRFLALCGRLVCLAGLLAPAPAFAQKKQSVNFFVGGFNPDGEDSRVEGDVLVSDLDFFLFDLDDFTSAKFGAEWLLALGTRSEVGFGVGVSSESVPSVFRDLINENGAEIRQDLKLRVVPITATYRFLPAGRRGPVQPYIGVGLGILSWRYTETGEFVDFDGFIFRDRFEGSGTNFGPLYLGGARVPLGALQLGGEVRYQSGSGEVDPFEFAGATKVDLGGWSYLVTVNVPF